MLNIVNYSGGKDSTAMLLKLIEMGVQIDDIVYVEVMATPTLSAEYPDNIKYINKMDDYLYDTIHKRITRIPSAISFEEQFYKIRQRGNHIGMNYGFPKVLSAWCNDRLKMVALKRYYKKYKDIDYVSHIGITADEPNRYKRLKENERAILYELGMTEADCQLYLKEKGLYNPLYDTFSRTRCWFCVKQNLKELRKLRKLYPDLWNMLLEWQKDSDTSFKDNYTMQELEKRFKGEELREWQRKQN